MKEDPDSLSGSSGVGAHMLIGMSGSNEPRTAELGMTPAEFALIKASLRQARAKAESLLSRADRLTERAASHCLRQGAPDGQAGHRVAGACHESC